MNIHNILQILKESEFKFAFNSNNKYYFINNNIVSKKLEINHIQNIYEYVIKNKPENEDLNFETLLEAVVILCKENTFNPEKEAKELAKQKEKEAKELAKQKEKEAKQKEQNEEILLIENIIKQKYPNLAIDENGNIRDNGKLIGGKLLRNISNKIYTENNIKETCKYITINKIGEIISKLASLKQYRKKITEDITFDDIINKIDEVSDGNMWINYIDDGSDPIFACSLYLLYSDTYCGLLHYNIYDKLIYYGDTNKVASLKKMDDILMTSCRVNAQMKLNKQISRDTIMAAFNNIKDYIAYNPFDMLMGSIMNKYPETEGYKYNWDGVDRVHELFIRFFNCPDNDYYRLIPELMLCQCIKVNYGKNMEDHKTDFAYFIFGAQGCGKTEFLQKLFYWMYYSPANLKDKMQLSYSMVGKYLCLWDELKGLQNEPIETIKEWVTMCKLDQVRKYDAFESTLLKTWVDIGTSNEEYWFDDYGYERRFICITIPDSSANRTEEYWNTSGFDQHYIDQVWLQALNIYEEKYKNNRIKLTQDAIEYNRKEQISHNKIMYDQQAIEALTALSIYDYEFDYYNELNKYIFKQCYNNILSGSKIDGFIHKLKRVDDYIIRLIIKRKDSKIKLMMTEYFGWELHEYIDDYNKPRYYFTRD